MPWSIVDLIRNDPQKYAEYLKKRQIDPKLAFEFYEIDKEWRKTLTLVNELRHKHNTISRSIGRAPREEKPKLVEEARRLLRELQKSEEKLRSLEELRRQLLLQLPNIVEDDVPEGGEEDSVPIEFWGTPKVWTGYIDKFKEQTMRYGFNVDYSVIEWKPVGHADMLEYVLKLGNTVKAGEVAGSRFYYLFDDIVWLDFALLMYAIDYLTSKGYTIVTPPYMLKHEVVQAVIDLETFKDAIYKIDGEQLYLISTAEHPLAALYYKEEIYDDELPIKLAGVSPCFRKEAGAGNRDLKGIFRVHQFHKVEQFIYSLPEESRNLHQEIISNAKELFKGLGIPFRIINIAAGDLGACAVKKYDLEAWMPAQGRYREMVSASNCTDWQSYRLGIRLIRRKGMERSYVHTLNSTAIASTRTITAILENYQREDGIVEIPRVLRKYLEPFRSAPKDYIHPREKPPAGRLRKVS